MLRIIPIFITILLLGNACQKEQTSITKKPGDSLPDTTVTSKDIIELGKCTCLKNGVLLTFNAQTVYYTEDKQVFVVSANYRDPYLRGYGFRVYDIPAKIGKYSLEAYYDWDEVDKIPQMALFVDQDYDQLIGTYKIDSTRNDHFIEVVSIDSVAGTVQGRFQFFTKEKNGNDPNSWGLDPKINLTEGKFHLKLK